MDKETRILLVIIFVCVCVLIIFGVPYLLMKYTGFNLWTGFDVGSDWFQSSWDCATRQGVANC